MMHAADRQIVVSGDAGYWSGPEGLKLDEYVLSLTGTPRPRMCAVFTASGDAEAHIRGFHDCYGTRCETSHLSLFLPPFSEPEQLLVRQDVIYVGGGSTANMLAVWRLHGIDQILRNCLDNGAILYGSSAGGICWFESGLTDSLSFDGSLRPLHNGLGLIAGSHAPHFDRPGRSATYAAMVSDGVLADGLGIDDFAAVHFVDGEVRHVVAAAPRATAHRVERRGDGSSVISALPSTLI